MLRLNMPDENEPTSPIDPLTIGELISLAEAAMLAGVTPKYLRDIAKNGRLRARKIGRNWATTKAAVEQYLNSRKFIYPQDDKTS